jgi:Urocanase Rossmann-like domain
MADQDIPDTAEVFDHFAALMTVAPEPGGSLVYYGELDSRGMAMAVAANIAGAASLGVDASVARAKLALRQGFCDFMVNSLDEALRILKNQIRKKEPVSVALVGDPEQVVAEMLERGVQPDLVACGGLQAEAFIERGAKVLPAAMAMCDSLVVTWSVSQDAAQWLPRVDAIAVDGLENASDPRAKWIRLAPRYLQKSLSRERYVRMRTDELLRFVGLLQQRTQSGEIAVPVQVSSGGLPVVQPAAADSSPAV